MIILPSHSSRSHYVMPKHAKRRLGRCDKGDAATSSRLALVATRNDLKGRAGTLADFCLYADGIRVISFAEGRIGYREWARRNGRLADNHSIEDRYDHNIEELMA
jgi:hypothetical protein